MGNDCATGVCFTRDPSTGENVFYGEYLVNAQGEDVVAGIRTPQPLSIARAKPGEIAMEQALPEVYAELVRVRHMLESHYHDMQDIEFTVQQNKLYMLQTRSGKRTAGAALRIAVEMAQDGLIDRAEAVQRVNPASLDQLLHPTLDPNAKRTLISKGLPASPGAACGTVVFSADEAELRAAHGESVILVRIETSPEDIHGMHAAQGILTTRGGMTSHAAWSRAAWAVRASRVRAVLPSITVRRPCRPAATSCAQARPSRWTAPPARCLPARCPWSSPLCRVISPP